MKAPSVKKRLIQRWQRVFAVSAYLPRMLFDERGNLCSARKDFQSARHQTKDCGWKVSSQKKSFTKRGATQVQLPLNAGFVQQFALGTFRKLHRPVEI